MTNLDPNARIQWQDKTILVYLDDKLADRSADIATAISDESERATTTDELRRGVKRVALKYELQLLTFAADGGHYDPLGDAGHNRTPATASPVRARGGESLTLSEQQTLGNFRSVKGGWMSHEWEPTSQWKPARVLDSPISAGSGMNWLHMFAWAL